MKKTVFTGVYDNLEMIDEIISQNAIGWKTFYSRAERMEAILARSSLS